MSYLTENVLPFWLKTAIDYKNGGIYTCLDEDGTIYDTEKSVWFQGRALYIFSVAYNEVEQNPEYLKAAKAIFDFLPKCSEEDGRMAFTVTETGEFIQKRRYYFSETFAAIGCTEYWLATGDENAKVLAEKYFDVAYGIYCDPSRTTPKFNPETVKFHALSPAMIMLATSQVLRKINKEKYNKIAVSMVDEIWLHFTEYGLLENVDFDGNFVNTSTGRVVNPGHALEAAWFLMVQSELTDDPSLVTTAAQIIDTAMAYGLAPDGGILTFRDCEDKPTSYVEWDMKKWWPQCEAMLATKMCYLKTKEIKYLDWYNTIEQYVESHFIDHKYGEWYGYLHYDGTVSNAVKGNLGKGPFHIPRMLLLLEKMDQQAAASEKLLVL